MVIVTCREVNRRVALIDRVMPNNDPDIALNENIFNLFPSSRWDPDLT